MQKILSYLKEHLKADFHLGFYLLIFTFLVISVICNYAFHFKKDFIDSQRNQFIKLVYYFLFFGFSYYITAISYAIFYKQYDFLKLISFWILSLFMIFILTLDRLSSTMSLIVLNTLDIPSQLFSYSYLCLISVFRAALIIFPIVIYKTIVDRTQDSLYGLTRKNFESKPYIIMLLIMLIPIIWASFQPSFLRTYPRYKPGAAERFLQQPHIVTMLIFQIFYAMRFIAVEMLFRGFMVMAMPKTMGRGVVMPMVVLYGFWHFGKPMGEAIGSVFGGYILGVIALESRTILGGIFVHIGVALLMEWTAYLQVYYFR
jgi:hypothetical protein